VVSLADLAQEGFVSLTTYRRSGDAVSVPVWIAPATDAKGGLLVTTTERSGQVKRLRRDRRVRLRPCDRRGAVAANAPTVAAQADIIGAAEEVRRMREAIRAKYGSKDEGHRRRSRIVDPAEPARVT
jgi:PPOX class probable F420-dependent enzyme